MTLQTDEFIRRFLLHVLPDRFVRIRHFGLLANRNRKDNIAACHKMLGGKKATKEKNRETWQEQLLRICGIDVTVCPVCKKGKICRIERLLPAGVDEMRTIYTIKSICPAFCEKNTLFRRGVLLPKNEHPSIIRSRMDPSIAFMVPIVDQIQLKTDVDLLVLPVAQCKIITKTRLKRHSPQHAA
jgi:hypothetical protein